MDLHLAPLIAAGILERRDDRYRVVADRPIVSTLRRLLAELGAQVGD